MQPPTQCLAVRKASAVVGALMTEGAIPATVLNFGYGSKMSTARMQTLVPSAIVFGFIVLQGHQLLWHRVTRNGGSGKYGAVSKNAPGGWVHGPSTRFERPRGVRLIAPKASATATRRSKSSSDWMGRLSPCRRCNVLLASDRPLEEALQLLQGACSCRRRSNVEPGTGAAREIDLPGPPQLSLERSRRSPPARPDSTRKHQRVRS